MRKALFLLFLLPSIAHAQVGGENNINVPRNVVDTVDVSSLIDIAAEPPFARAVAKAARKMRREGKINRVQQIRLRVAMLSPAFRQHAEELAVIQMAYSGSDQLPMTADGRVDVGKIDWDSLLDFIERLIPLILKLMEIFGGV